MLGLPFHSGRTQNCSNWQVASPTLCCNAERIPRPESIFMLLRDGWTGWAVRKRFPAKPMHIALYLQYLANTVKSKSATSVAVNALAWAHRMAGMESPTENSLVRTVVDALDRSLAQPKTRKEPVTAAMLEELVEKFGTGRL